jgi:hypothetical protein
LDGDLFRQSRNQPAFLLRGTPVRFLPNLASVSSQVLNGPQEYLNQAGTRKNLHVVVSSPVARVLFKDEKSAAGDVVASGVEFVHEGKTYTARASREVILSAG